MNSVSSKQSIRTFAPLVVAIVAIVYAGYLFSAQATAREELVLLQQSARTELLEQAAVVRRNGSDPMLDRYIFPCTEADRQTFERLLARLAVLEEDDLVVVEQLFPACGEFFARQKFALVQRLADQYTGYQHLLVLRSQFAPQEAAAEQALWERLVTLENERATQFAAFVALQGKLIENQRIQTDAATANALALDEAARIQSVLAALSDEVASVLDELRAYETSK